jgi:GNAT superfamily N-acetyltransferase
MAPIKIRVLDAASAEEIQLIAARMRQTLVEVLGEEKGTALYSMEWLLERVHYHLDRRQTTAVIYVAEDSGARIIGHAIARLEHNDDGQPFGYFSTIFVEPSARRRGVASALITRVESWLIDLQVPKVVYNTATGHAKVIRLFERHGYAITHRTADMVQLSRDLLK